MTQSYPDVPATDKQRLSRSKFLQRDEAQRSSFSGTDFPTDPAPLVGQSCFRTDEGKFYIFKGAPLNWVLAFPYVVDQGTSFPGTPAGVQFFYRTDLDAVFVHTDGDWLQIAPAVVAMGTAEPEEPADGALAWRTDQGRLKFYDGSSWIVIGPLGATEITRAHDLGGTGVASRTLAKVTSDWANAADWGVAAQSSGAGADQNTALTRAIAAVAAGGGGRLILPRGIIPLTGGLARQSKVMLEGQGQEATTLYLKSASNTWMFKSAAAHFGGFRDLTIDGNGDNQSSSSVLIEAACDDVVYENVFVKNTHDNGITIQQNDSNTTRSRRPSIRNCRFQNIGYHAISLSWSDDAVVSGNQGKDVKEAFIANANSHGSKIHGNGARNEASYYGALGFPGIRVSNGSRDCAVVGNTIEHFKRGIMALGAQRCVFSGNVTRDLFQQGFFVSRSDEGDACDNNTFQGNLVEYAGQGGGDPSTDKVGFFCRGAPDNTFIGNRVFDNAGSMTWGFVMVDYAGVQMIDNIFVGNAAKGMASGLAYWDRAGSNVIANNKP